MQPMDEYMRQDLVKQMNILLEFAQQFNRTKEIAEDDTSTKKHGVRIGVELTATAVHIPDTAALTASDLESAETL